MTGERAKRFRFTLVVTAALVAGSIDARADEPKTAGEKPATQGNDVQPKPTTSGSQKPFAVLLKDATRLPGLITLYRTEGKVYAELPPSLLGKEFFVSISIARGIGERSLLGGMS